ncbi:transposase [Leadbettera azotonutricia]|uniref:Transposase, is4 family n=1 Tax=Leadbettera azotonutricia (strain ATCC BAA-888 / DSM 13862 / ZAS-9) TaxID=545695 RepID=F5Y9P4_LEAAZ|nr:transposase [Leadbettera azotonutricia]AEF82752.1 transposase, is4 family [Leadbettera azotonutricia ZAS-9]
MKSITQIVGGKQGLFEGFHELQQFFEEHLGGEQRNFILILQVIESCSPRLIHTYRGVGRKAYDYMNFFRAFFAVNHFGIPNMKALVETLRSDPNLRQLCGFKKVPSRSTFSRRLNDISKADVLNDILDELVKQAYKDLPVIHICRDSTAIESRESPKEKTKGTVPKALKKRERRPKDAPKTIKEPTVLAQQAKKDISEITRELNQECAWGCKKNSQGKVSYWKGYKLHLDVTDTGFPVSAFVSGANVHDSQAAILLEKMTMGKVRHLYSVMDAAYDAKDIKQFIRRHRRVPVIDPNSRNDKICAPLDPAKQERYKIRTTVERAYSHLKDNLIPGKIYVKGNRKVTFVLMIAVLCLAAQKYLHYFKPCLA